MMKSMLAVALLLSSTPHLCAQSYPNQPINVVIPLAPGDAADIACRAMAEELSKLLKVPVIVANKPGAGGTLGTGSAVKAKKDGYTILLTNNAALIYNRILTPESVAYDPFKDLTPLGLSTRFPLLLLVRPDAPYKSFNEMVEFAKKNPGKVHVGTVGAGSVGHFTLEIINTLTGAGLIMVPFKGASPGVAAILGGQRRWFPLLKKRSTSLPLPPNSADWAWSKIMCRQRSSSLKYARNIEPWKKSPRRLDW